jgi:trehalose 6-phosphate phosphatase
MRPHWDADIAGIAMFLNVDGTILDVAETPESVVVPASMARTLGELRARIGGALALVSGRLIANLDDLFFPLELPCIGGHGAEMRIFRVVLPNRGERGP